VHIWIASKIGKIKACHCDFDKSYYLELQQNQDAAVISSI
jgi:hypothetical protein